MSLQVDKNRAFEEVGALQVMDEIANIKGIIEGFNSKEVIDSAAKYLLPFAIEFLLELSREQITKTKGKRDAKADEREKKREEKAEEKDIERGRKNDAKVLKKNNRKKKEPKDREEKDIIKLLKKLLIAELPNIVMVIKEGIIKAIKAGLACGVDFTIPTPTPTLTDDVNKVDFFGMMKIDPNGVGGVLFGNASRDFNRFLYDIISTQGSGVWKDSSNIPLIDVSFDGTTQKLTMTVSSIRGGTSFHEFLVDYINSIDLLTQMTMMATLIDSLSGVLSGTLNIGFETILDRNKMDSSVNRLLNTDPITDRVIIDDSFFNFNGDELLKMEEDAGNKFRGVSVMDLGCGLVEVAIPMEVLDDLRTIDTLPPNKVRDTMNQLLLNIGDSVAGDDSNPDKSSMEDKFNKDAITSLPSILMRAVITPQVISIFQVAHKTINDTTLNVTTGYDFSKSARVFFEYVVREIGAILLKVVVEIVIIEVTKLVATIAKVKAVEKVKLYIGILKSATGGLADKLSDAADKINDTKSKIPGQ